MTWRADFNLSVECLEDLSREKHSRTVLIKCIHMYIIYCWLVRLINCTEGTAKSDVCIGTYICYKLYLIHYYYMYMRDKTEVRTSIRLIFDWTQRSPCIVDPNRVKFKTLFNNVSIIYHKFKITFSPNK